MKYDVPKLIERYKSGEILKYVFFWGHTKTDSVTKSCFSQWYESAFEVEGVLFHTAEHWMMAQKALLFNDRDSYEQIVAAGRPGKVKELGRQIRNFDQQIWEHERYGIVVKGNYHKFTQNADLKTFLINTHNRILVEASPVDPVWGIGLAHDSNSADKPDQWKGLNLLGFALMEVRDLLHEITD